MQESTSKYAVGIDIGTTTVRCVVGHIDSINGTPTIVGVGVAENSGMRKGNVVNLDGPAKAIDDALGEAELMSGYQVDYATISINGTHILSTQADGMIAVGSANHEITKEDLARIEDVATVGKVPANREILEVVPHAYKLDGQDGIKNPVGMTGTRLEIDAHVVSVMSPNLINLEKAADSAKVAPRSIVITGVAAGKAVLNEHQTENGVAIIDIGGSTTNIAIYDEGDLQFTSVLPVGGINITNDLAIGLKTDLDIAEKIKLEHASALIRKESAGVSIEYDGKIHSFMTNEIDDIVDARLEELFESINGELKRAGRAGRLPSGVVLTGGTASLVGICDYAKESLGLSAKIGVPGGFAGVADNISQPQFATAVGLMLIDAEYDGPRQSVKAGGKNKLFETGVGGVLSKLIGRFRI